MTLDDALKDLRSKAVPGHDLQSRAYHKIDRPYLGVANPEINKLTASWRRRLTLDQQTGLAKGLWETNIYEARLAAAKLLTQNRMADDAGVWSLLCSWVPDFDSWAIADHVCMAGQKRLLADPQRLEEIAKWTTSRHLWTRRAAMVITLPLAKPKNPSADEIAARETVLGWAASYVDDPEWFIQKSIAWWLRELSKHQPARARVFLEMHGAQMKNFARKEASKYL